MFNRIILILIINFWSCLGLNAQIGFSDVTVEAGLDHAFEVFQGTFGGGAAVIDYDNDGYEDIFIAGGQARDSFYRNNGDGTFTDITESAGLAINNNIITQGAVTADVNRDGFIDIFVTTIAAIVDGQEIPRASDILYLNNGDGSFKDASESYGLTNIKTFSTGAAFGDINADGFPDLFVSNYFDQFSGNLNKISGGTITGEQRPSKDQLYLNNHGRFFNRVDAKYGIDSEGFGFGGIFTDFDNDNDLDLYVYNDFGDRAGRNKLYQNEYPEEKFTEISRIVNVDFGINAMGAAFGDYNKDGFLDYFVSNLSISPFIVNKGPGSSFSQLSTILGTGFNSLDVPGSGLVIPISWGAVMFDCDHDTDLDLFISNGALNPSVIPNPNLFLEFDGEVFLDKSQELNMNDYGIGRGAVTFDYDNDGDLDLFIVNQKPVWSASIVGTVKSILYRNDTQTGNWLKVSLEGINATSRGLGARIEVVVNGEKLIREIDGGSSHESQNSTVAHFGLAHSTQVDSVTVKWVGGHQQSLTQVQANQHIHIKEDINNVVSPFSLGDVSVYPSYFNNKIAIRFELAQLTSYSLEVIDPQGRQVEVLVNKAIGFTGTYNWKVPPNLQPGVYFFRIKSDIGSFVTRGVKL